MYTKRKLAEGIVKFMNNDLIPAVDNERLKFVLCVCKKALYENPAILDTFFDNPIVSGISKCEEEDCYDISVLAKAMKSVLSEYESYPVVIPNIPVFAPDKNVIRVTGEDIDKLMSYLEETEA